MYQNNTVNLIGFTGKDVNARFTKNNRAFAVVLVATKSFYRDKQSNEVVSRTDWHRCIAWGKLAQVAEKLAKGVRVKLEGELRTREYIDREENKRRVQEVHLRSIRTMDRVERRTGNVPPTVNSPDAAAGVPF